MQTLLTWASTWHGLAAGKPFVPSPPSEVEPPSAPMVAVQPMAPVRVWSWPVDPNGTTSNKKWFFCDTIPKSWGDMVPFRQGAQSFTSNYQTFLESLDPEVLETPLKLARQKLRDASRTRVLISESTAQERLAWVATSTPPAFMTSVAGSRPQSISLPVPAKKHGDLPLVQGTQDNGTVRLDDHFETVTITADGFGNVQLSPDGWYDSGLIRSARMIPGAFKKGYSAERGGGGVWFFGEGGLLQSRSVSLLVAANPRVVAELRTGREVASAVRSCHKVRLAGLDFTEDELELDGSGRLTGRLESSQPMMLGVQVEPIAHGTESEY